MGDALSVVHHVFIVATMKKNNAVVASNDVDSRNLHESLNDGPYVDNGQWCS